jgi:prepilin-type processing-associated H-X9-DG protein
LNNSIAPASVNSSSGRHYINALKTSQLNMPGPANIFSFVDESAYTLLYTGRSVFSFDPGLSLGMEYWRNLPAFYHGKAGNISFADGHAEIHKWLAGTTYKPIVVGQTTSAHIFCSGSPDYQYFSDHTPYN